MELVYSDHSPTSIECVLSNLEKIRPIWRLDNNILLNKDVVNRIRVELEVFLSINKTTTDKAIFWDTLKAYVREVCISQKAYLNKKRKTLLDEKLEEIRELEQQYELTNNKDIKNKMEIKNFVKTVDATQAVRDVMCAQQNIIEYRDKPNKHLGRVLADRKEQYSFTETMINKEGQIVKDLEGKLNIFSGYYANLYVNGSLLRRYRAVPGYSKNS